MGGWYWDPCKLGYNLASGVAPSQTCCPMVLWLFQLHEKDNAGQKEGLISMSCKGEEQDLRATQEGNVRQARSLHTTGEWLRHHSESLKAPQHLLGDNGLF